MGPSLLRVWRDSGGGNLSQSAIDWWDWGAHIVRGGVDLRGILSYSRSLELWRYKNVSYQRWVPILTGCDRTGGGSNDNLILSSQGVTRSTRSSQSAIGPRDRGFQIVRGCVDPGELNFRLPGVGVLQI